MGTVRATVVVDAPVEIVYQYLRHRYGRPAHVETSEAIKGYVPPVICKEADEPHFVCFSVKGRDAWTNMSASSWEWDYRIQEAATGTSEVTICYRWSWVLSVMTAGTARPQACNELIETAMALDALNWSSRLQDPLPRSSTEICEQPVHSTALRLHSRVRPPGVDESQTPSLLSILPNESLATSST